VPPEQPLLASHEIVGWSELKGETFLLGRDDPSQDFHDLLVAKLASPGDRPKVIQNDVTGETIKSLVGAGFGVSLLRDACAGTTSSIGRPATATLPAASATWRNGTRAMTTRR